MLVPGFFDNMKKTINELSLPCLYWLYEEEKLKLYLRFCAYSRVWMVMLSKDMKSNQGGDSFGGKMRYLHLEYGI